MGIRFAFARILEVRAGIEPTYADLQSAASPFCHRTGERCCYISQTVEAVKLFLPGS